MTDERDTDGGLPGAPSDTASPIHPSPFDTALDTSRTGERERVPGVTGAREDTDTDMAGSLDTAELEDR